MLLALSPLPEEIEQGYLGRVMRINGYRSLAELSDSITELYQVERLAQGRSWFDMLCKVANMSSEKFAQRHTPLPLKRGITSYFPEIAHGATGRPTITRQALYRKYAAAFFCEQCAQADIAFHGMSYWRREHQTPGQLWCSKHGCALSSTAEPDAMLSSPAKLIDQSCPIPLAAVQEAQANPFVERYLELVAAIYERIAPLDVGKIAPVLRDQAKRHGFHAYAGPVRSALLSDRICEIFPHSWLERVFPSLLDKKKGEVLHQVDGTLYMRKSSSSTVAYLLVLATLFETADEAINTLQAAQSGALVPEVLLRQVRYALPADDALVEAYIRAQGDVSNIVQMWEIPKRCIQKRLLELGLPDLAADPGQAVFPKASLQAFYLSKCSYQESLMLSGMDSRQFDGLLRCCGPIMVKALIKMDKEDVRCSRKELSNNLRRLHATLQGESPPAQMQEV